jgi:hypothetical protein
VGIIPLLPLFSFLLLSQSLYAIYIAAGSIVYISISLLLQLLSSFINNNDDKNNGT